MEEYSITADFDRELPPGSELLRLETYTYNGFFLFLFSNILIIYPAQKVSNSSFIYKTIPPKLNSLTIFSRNGSGRRHLARGHSAGHGGHVSVPGAERVRAVDSGGAVFGYKANDYGGRLVFGPLFADSESGVGGMC